MEQYVTVKRLIEILSDVDKESIVIKTSWSDYGKYFIPLIEKDIHFGKYENEYEELEFGLELGIVHYPKLTETLMKQSFPEHDIGDLENKNGIKCIVFE